MSRFGDYEGDDSGKNTSGLWAANVKRALSGRRGQQALRDLRDALVALPEKRLIEGALCTVEIQKRIAAMPETKVVEVEPILRDDAGQPQRDENGRLIRGPKRPETVKNWERTSLIEFVEEHKGQPEGVCAVGAYVWWTKVKAGMDPAAAFDALPVLPDTDTDGWETARVGEDAGLTSVLATQLAWINDERLDHLSPEARYEWFLDWIDRHLHQAATPAGSVR